MSKNQIIKSKEERLLDFTFQVIDNNFASRYTDEDLVEHVKSLLHYLNKEREKMKIDPHSLGIANEKNYIESESDKQNYHDFKESIKMKMQSMGIL